MHILMVCLGNICRSPLAEGILRKKIEYRNLPWVVDSCGTSNYHIGCRPDQRMIETASFYDIEISNLKARQFSLTDFNTFDVIYAMDKNNFRNINELARNDSERKKVRLLLNEWRPGEDLEVPDPYYGTKQDFISVFNILDEALDSLILNLNEKK